MHEWNTHGHVTSGGQSSSGVTCLFVSPCIRDQILASLSQIASSQGSNLVTWSPDDIQWSVSDLNCHCLNCSPWQIWNCFIFVLLLLLIFKVKTNTPLSGPGILKAVRKRGRKRKINEALSMQEGDEESLENEYRGMLSSENDSCWNKKKVRKFFITTACIMSSRLMFGLTSDTVRIKMSTLESCQNPCLFCFQATWA